MIGAMLRDTARHGATDSEDNPAGQKTALGALLAGRTAGEAGESEGVNPGNFPGPQLCRAAAGWRRLD